MFETTASAVGLEGQVGTHGGIRTHHWSASKADDSTVGLREHIYGATCGSRTRLSWVEAKGTAEYTKIAFMEPIEGIAPSSAHYKCAALLTEL